MATYVCLLRAVNVGGTSVVTMARLRTAFEAMGFADVRTHIQSGNVVFTATGARSQVAARIRAGLAEQLGMEPDVFLLTPGEVRAAVASNPLDAAGRGQTHQTHLMFLAAVPKVGVGPLVAAGAGQYAFAIHGKVLYYQYPKELAGKRKAVDIERILGVRGTARTWKVVDALVAVAGDQAKPS